jgi:hypothetical protein
VPFSDDIRLMFRPFAGYRALAVRDDQAPGRSALEKAVFLLFVIGAFVSLTSAGRLVAFHVASSMVFWSFAPALQSVAVTLALRTVAPGVDVRRALALYFSGHAPWMILLVALAAAPIVAPNTYVTMTWLFRSGVIPVAFLGAIAWGGILTYACFRTGLGLARGQAIKATALFYAAYVGSILGYYLATNQIQPQFPGIP